MKPHLTLFCALAIAFASSNANADSLRPDHPIIGTWKLSLQKENCSELYEFKADGKSHVVSAKEISERNFEISDQPNENRIYKWSDKTIKTNKKKDCSNSSTPIGSTSTAYIVFNSTASEFIMCQQEDMKRCIGPFHKQ